jgi:transposase
MRFPCLDGEFEALYTDFGRPSVAPERLIRASLIQILFSIRITPEACFQHDAAVDGTDAI